MDQRGLAKRRRRRAVEDADRSSYLAAKRSFFDRLFAEDGT